MWLTEEDQASKTQTWLPKPLPVVGRVLLCVFVCAQSWFFVTLWTVAHHAPLSLGFSRQEYWSGLPFPNPWNFPDPGIEPTSLTSPALANGFFTTNTAWEAPRKWHPNTETYFQEDYLAAELRIVKEEGTSQESRKLVREQQMTLLNSGSEKWNNCYYLKGIYTG